MNENYTVTEIDIKAIKKAQFKAKVHRTVNGIKNWFIDNKEAIILLAPICIGAFTACVKVVGKRANLNKEQDLKDLYCYDRSLGHYWRLRRELTNKEWVEIDNRKKNGERLGDILNELKVLK